MKYNHNQKHKNSFTIFLYYLNFYEQPAPTHLHSDMLLLVLNKKRKRKKQKTDLFYRELRMLESGIMRC